MISLVEILELSPPFVLQVATETVAVRAGSDADGKPSRKRRKKSRQPICSPSIVEPSRASKTVGQRVAETLRTVTHRPHVFTLARGIKSQTTSAFLPVPAPEQPRRRPQPKPVDFAFRSAAATFAAVDCGSTYYSLIAWDVLCLSKIAAIDSDADARFIKAGKSKRFHDRFRMARETEEEMIIAGTF